LNALDQISIQFKDYSLNGFSVSGLSTYVQVPEMDLCFDMGECPLSAVGLNHVFLTHAHGDHSRCLMRHDSLRKMMNIEKPAVYYLPDYLVESAKALFKAESKFEGVSEEKYKEPFVIGLNPLGENIPLVYRKDLAVQAFNVQHSVPAVGYTLYRRRKKLRPELIGKSPQELIELRKAGTQINFEILDPTITFIGDCLGISLIEEAHIWKSETLVIESTFILEDEKKMALKKGHTHLADIVSALEIYGDNSPCQNVVLKHFSMKYSKGVIQNEVHRLIPERFKNRIHLFI
jgi:ribonuclease Z